MELRDTPRLLRTLRGLRWRQWAYRPLRRLQARAGAPPRLRAATPHPARAAALAAEWRALAGCDPRQAQRAREVLAGRFELVGEARTLPRPDWLARPVSPLWTYHLHYFDYAADLAALPAPERDAAARCFEALAGGWLEQTAGGRGPGWEPYALSLRVVNWMRARTRFGEALSPAWGARLDAALHQQLRHLNRRLEWHILANHLQKNLHALVLGGLYFGGAEAEGWLPAALARLWRELREQVLDDGGHFERSPMYHTTALGDFLELLVMLAACGVAVPPEARARVARMTRAWTRLTRPGGEPQLFNDAAEGAAPPGPCIARLATRALGELPEGPRGAWALPDSGYFGFAGEGGDRLMLDCGPPGPRYQPGHAHCDALSFELDLAGGRVVVDSGTSGYAGDPLREYARSTRAHNTVQVGEREQSEVWGSFRVGGMARVRPLRAAAEGAPDFSFAGECSPWHSPRCAHRRRIERRGEQWWVEDVVEGADGAPLRSFLHLHPRFEVRLEGSRALASDGAERVVVECRGADRLGLRRGEERPAQGWYSPRFGERTPAPVLELQIERNQGRAFGFTLHREQR